MPNSVSATAAEYPLSLSAAHSVVGGKAFTVKVVWFPAKGSAKPLSGARVTVRGQTLTTNSHGTVHLTSSSAGSLVINAAKKNYVRAAPIRVRVSR